MGWWRGGGTHVSAEDKDLVFPLANELVYDSAADATGSACDGDGKRRHDWLICRVDVFVRGQLYVNSKNSMLSSSQRLIQYIYIHIHMSHQSNPPLP